MRKIKLYIAMSLNGKIARLDGSVDWLESIPNPENSDYGYADFYKSIDVTLQGNSTYKQVMGWGIEFPYADKKNYVFTTQKGLENTEHVDFISENHIDFLRRLKQESGKDIWLVGGGKLNTMFLNENIIDEIQLFVMPIILPDGIELFEAIPNETKLKMLQTMSHSSGVVELIYKVEETQN